MARREGEWVEWIRARAGHAEGVIAGIGDDAAVLDPGTRGPLVLACDQLLESVHFAAGVDPWPLVGRKALARVLSDLGAMAARPWVALVSVSVPAEGREVVLESLMQGLLDYAAEENVAVVGGDLAHSPGGVYLDVTAMGLLEGRRAWRRNGAQVGDRLFVTGPLGGSREGHHLRFRPRWREALRIAELGVVHAAIDLSDGLGQDLPRLCAASGVGALLRLAALPRRRLRDGRSATELAALHDGEDFELLLAVDRGEGEAFRRLGQELGLDLREVGEITPAGLRAESESGVVQEFSSGGYEHF